MKSLVIVAILLGEVLSSDGVSVVKTLLTVETDEGKIVHVNEKLNLEDFPCNPYPSMLFYYTEAGHLRCGEPPE